MRKQTNRRRKLKAARWRIPLGCYRLFILAFLVTTVAGCPNRSAKMPGGDPLKGELFPPQGAENASPITQSKAEVPPIPNSSTSMSTAAIAAVPLQGGKTLNIADPNAQGQTVNQSDNSSWKAKNSGGGQDSGVQTILGKPQPINNPELKKVGKTEHPNSGIQPSGYTFPSPGGQNSPPAGTVQQTIAQLEEELNKRNVIWKKMYKTETGVKFVCAVPHPQNPKAERVIESYADDPFTAVHKALVTIDRP